MVQAPYDLERFVAAQSGTFEQALAEIEAGRKQGHWIWFVFPQMRGLGASAMANHYGIGSRAEAQAFLAHPLLGRRLERITGAVLALPGGRSLHAVFGSPDDMKFRSSMTLFAQAAPADASGPFRSALERFCGGREDERTLALLGDV